MHDKTALAALHCSRERTRPNQTLAKQTLATSACQGPTTGPPFNHCGEGDCRLLPLLCRNCFCNLQHTTAAARWFGADIMGDSSALTSPALTLQLDHRHPNTCSPSRKRGICCLWLLCTVRCAIRLGEMSWKRTAICSGNADLNNVVLWPQWMCNWLRKNWP